MRIISGKYKGRNILGYNIIGTRPTMDRVRESLFAMIQNKVKNSICLDLFAGSGSLGFEALSNGALKCYFVDKNIKVINTLKKNYNNLKIEEETYFTNNDFLKALQQFKRQEIKFDIIFLDPPYDDNLITPALKAINELDLLSDEGIIICEYEKEKIGFNYEVIKEKKYGDKYITILKK